jgi:hypothetical protein
MSISEMDTCSGQDKEQDKTLHYSAGHFIAGQQNMVKDSTVQCRAVRFRREGQRRECVRKGGSDREENM